MSKKFKLYCALHLPNELIQYLESNELEVTTAKTIPVSRQELLESISECDAIYCIPSITIDKEFLDVAKNLKVLVL